MKKLLITGTAVLGLLVITHFAMAQRGGAVRGGMRGAAIGGLAGGSSGAATGAKVGVVTGATRSAIDRESQARMTYESTPEYKNYQGSNFNEAPPTVLTTSESMSQATPAAKPTGEAVIRKDNQPIVGVTFPADWKQRMGDNFVSAVSGDGHAWAMFVMLKPAENEKVAIDRVKTGLETYMTDLKFDEPAETKGGATVMTGTGKGKKAGVELAFAAGVFDAGDGQLIGAAFVVDSKLEDHYKETVRGICETIRRTADFEKK